MNEQWDELISAYLDGEATEDERAQVEASPEALADVQAIQRVIRANQQVEPAPPATRSLHLASALDAFDQPAQTPVSDLASARTRASAGTRPERRLPAWLGQAAAAVLVVGGLGVGAYALRSSDEVDTASEAFDDSGEDGAMADEAVPAPEGAASSEIQEEGMEADDSTDADTAAMDDSSADSAGDDESAEPAPTSTTTLDPAEQELRSYPSDTPIDEIAAELLTGEADPAAFQELEACDDPSLLPAGIADVGRLLFDARRAVLIESVDGELSIVVVEPPCAIVETSS